MMVSDEVNSGKVLLAEPFMLDPNFKRSAVLLCEHNDEGSIGFIMNKPMKVRVDLLIADFPDFAGGKYQGGGRGVLGRRFRKAKVPHQLQADQGRKYSLLRRLLRLVAGTTDRRNEYRLLGARQYGRKLPVQIQAEKSLATGYV